MYDMLTPAFVHVSTYLRLLRFRAQTATRLALNLRSSQPKTTTCHAFTTKSTQRILPVIKSEHATLHAHTTQILRGLNPDEQTRYQNQFTWELARHMIGEELVVYPAIVAHVQHGTALSNKNRLEHQDLKEQLKMFQGLRSTDPRFAPTLEALAGELETHAHREESEDLVFLEKELSDDESQELTRSIESLRVFLPSRSHPLAPNKPPFETAAGLLMAPMDLVADLFRKWPRSGDTDVKW